MVIRKGNNMKKTVITITIVFILSINSYILYAGMAPPGYSLWASGDFDLPNDINNIKNASELKPYLNGDDTYRQTAAIRKLGEIEGVKAVDTLKNYLKRDSSGIGFDALPSLTKLEAIRTLGRIGSEQAKTILLDFLKLYLKKGPILPDKYKDDKRYYDYDRNFTYAVPELLKALYKWSSENDVYDYAKSIAESNDVKKYYGGPDGIGQRAWEIYIKGELLKKGIVEEKISITYLLDNFENVVPLSGNLSVLSSLKGTAIKTIIMRQSDSALSLALSEYRERLINESPSSSQYTTLNKRVSYINRITEEKKEAKAKLEAYKKQIAERR
jgi:hypothetical protein